MSTRSYICIQEDANKYKGIYCHHDGYLSYNGMLLQNFYSKRETVEELINLGDISSLNEKLILIQNITHLAYRIYPEHYGS